MAAFAVKPEDRLKDRQFSAACLRCYRVTVVMAPAHGLTARMAERLPSARPGSGKRA